MFSNATYLRQTRNEVANAQSLLNSVDRAMLLPEEVEQLTVASEALQLAKVCLDYRCPNVDELLENYKAIASLVEGFIVR